MLISLLPGPGVTGHLEVSVFRASLELILSPEISHLRALSSFFFFLSAAWGTFPDQGSYPSPCVGSLNHWIAREVPGPRFSVYLLVVFSC